jgi:hypothetical protein
MLDLQSLFEKYSEEYLQFERVENPRHPRADLCAFLMLHDLAPQPHGRNIVGRAKHDEVWLDADCDALATSATEEDVVTLIRCGVRFDSGNHAFAMFT